MNVGTPIGFTARDPGHATSQPDRDPLDQGEFASSCPTTFEYRFSNRIHNSANWNAEESLTL